MLQYMSSSVTTKRTQPKPWNLAGLNYTSDIKKRLVTLQIFDRNTVAWYLLLYLSFYLFYLSIFYLFFCEPSNFNRVFFHFLLLSSFQGFVRLSSLSSHLIPNLPFSYLHSPPTYKRHSMQSFPPFLGPPPLRLMDSTIYLNVRLRPPLQRLMDCSQGRICRRQFGFGCFKGWGPSRGPFGGETITNEGTH